MVAAAAAAVVAEAGVVVVVVVVVLDTRPWPHSCETKSRFWQVRLPFLIFWVGQKHTIPMFCKKDGVQSRNVVSAGIVEIDADDDDDDDSRFARAKKQAAARSCPPAVTNIF